jgi:hypothetical protein
VGVVGCTGCVAPHCGAPVGGRGLVGRGPGRGLREHAHAVQHLLEHVAQVGELAGDIDAGELLVDCRAPLYDVMIRCTDIKENYYDALCIL